MIFVCVKGSWPCLSVDVIWGENNLAFYVMKESTFESPHYQIMLFCSRDEINP